MDDANETVGPSVRPPTIRFLKAYYDLFLIPQWPMALVAGFLCMLVHQVLPFVPFIVFGGYLAILLESQVRTPGYGYPAFSFDQFSEYMNRGIWPFLIALPFGIMFFALYMVSYLGGMFGLVFATQNQDPETVGASFAILFPALIFTWVTALLLCQIILAGLFIRGSLTKSFTGAFKLRWQIDFIRKTWFELIVASIYLTLSSQILTLLGTFLFCVGAFIGSAWGMIAYAFVLAQLYRLYIARGGERIQLAPVQQLPTRMPTQTIYPQQQTFQATEES